MTFALTRQQAADVCRKLGIAVGSSAAAISEAVHRELDGRAGVSPAIAPAHVDVATGARSSGVPAGHVKVSTAELAELESQRVAGREAFLDLNARKFAPANRDAWAKEYDRDPKGTRVHFATAPDMTWINDLAELAPAVPASQTLEDITESAAYMNWSLG